MGLEHWGAGRMLLLLATSFIVGLFLAIGIFFRLSGETYAVSEGVRGVIAMALAAGVAGSWLFLLISLALPQLRSAALILLIGAFLANMAVPSFLPLVK